MRRRAGEKTRAGTIKESSPLPLFSPEHIGQKIRAEKEKRRIYSCYRSFLCYGIFFALLCLYGAQIRNPFFQYPEMSAPVLSTQWPKAWEHYSPRYGKSISFPNTTRPLSLPLSRPTVTVQHRPRQLSPHIFTFLMIWAPLGPHINDLLLLYSIVIARTETRKPSMCTRFTRARGPYYINLKVTRKRKAL